MKKGRFLVFCRLALLRKENLEKTLINFSGTGPFFSHIVDKTYRKAGECAYFLWEKISP